MINKITKLYYDTFHPDGIEWKNGGDFFEPISITMLLRLVEEKLELGDMYFIKGSGEFMGYKIGGDIFDICFFDLTKGDLLKNQDKKTINKIAKLLNI